MGSGHGFRVISDSSRTIIQSQSGTVRTAETCRCTIRLWQCNPARRCITESVLPGDRHVEDRLILDDVAGQATADFPYPPRRTGLNSVPIGRRTRRHHMSNCRLRFSHGQRLWAGLTLIHFADREFGSVDSSRVLLRIDASPTHSHQASIPRPAERAAIPTSSSDCSVRVLSWFRPVH